MESNTIRKRLSTVKLGNFAQIYAPTQVHSVVLSDTLSDTLDIITSGPGYPDFSTAAYAKAIIAKYSLRMSEVALALIEVELPQQLDNATTEITGSVR